MTNLDNTAVDIDLSEMGDLSDLVLGDLCNYIETLVREEPRTYRGMELVCNTVMDYDCQITLDEARAALNILEDRGRIRNVGDVHSGVKFSERFTYEAVYG